MPAPPARELQPGFVWFLAPFARVPLPAWAIGLLISLAIMALYLAMELAYQAAGAATGPVLCERVRPAWAQLFRH